MRDDLRLGPVGHDGERLDLLIARVAATGEEQRVAPPHGKAAREALAEGRVKLDHAASTKPLIRFTSASSNESCQLRLQSTQEPRMRRSVSSIPTTAVARPPLIASTVGSTGIRFSEIARSESSVLFSKVLVTTNMPAEAISSGTRLGCGVSISERPTECSRKRERYSPWL